MSVYVKMDKDYLADVGFGDLFVRPLEIRAGVQNDGRNYFKIERHTDNAYLLLMSEDGISYQSKYTFNLAEAPISRFEKICFDKQTNPNSYFVKNTICTKPTDTGRLTLFNNKLIEKRRNERIEMVIADDDHMRDQLKEKFEIVLR